MGKSSQPFYRANGLRKKEIVEDIRPHPLKFSQGELWGALTSKEEFGDYHLSLEVKWGEKKWPPREQRARDSGVLYHCVGPQGAVRTFWMRSFECQIQEHDFGDLIGLPGVSFDIEAEPSDPANPQSMLMWKKGGRKFTGIRQRIIRNRELDKLTGWNTVEVICLGQTAIHVVNGKVNMILTGLSHEVDGRRTPLTRGRLQLQSESAEVFYRNIRIRPITEIPKTSLLH